MRVPCKGCATRGAAAGLRQQDRIGLNCIQRLNCRTLILQFWMYESLGEACFIKQKREGEKQEEGGGEGETEAVCQGLLLISSGLS